MGKEWGVAGRGAAINPLSMVPLNHKCQLLPWVFPPFLAISDSSCSQLYPETDHGKCRTRGHPILWWELLFCQAFGWWNPPLISNLSVASTRDADLNHLNRALSGSAHQELRCRPQRRHWRSAGSAATGAVQEEWRKQLGQLGSRSRRGLGPLGLVSVLSPQLWMTMT
jgi:hypothetical protein